MLKKGKEALWKNFFICFHRLCRCPRHLCPRLLHSSPVAAPFVNCLLSTEDYFKAVFVPDSDKLIIYWSWANAKSCEGEIKFHCKQGRPLKFPGPWPGNV